jgi:arginase family enzyme
MFRILNFDNSVTKQQALLSSCAHEIIDLTSLGPRARFWMSPRVMAQVENKISGSKKNAVTFLGSGDFHHISKILISQFEEPLSVFVFDHHPDWCSLPARLNCGSWVSQVIKQKNVLKTVLVGNASGDLSDFEIQTGNIDSLKDDRVEIYPYEHAPTKIFLKKIPSNRSICITKGILTSRVHWTELKGKDLTSFFQALLARLPARKVYVSIDKDCLKNDFAITNWEEGKLSLEELLLMVRLIKENTEIVGADIVGDYSPIRLSGMVKKCISHFDHPKKLKAHALPESLVASINERTNLKILQVLNS